MTNKPKLGDRIIVIDPKLDVIYGKECVIIKVIDLGISYIDATPIYDPKEDILLLEDQYEVIEEDGAEIVVDDKVICTNQHRLLLYGKVFYVLEVYQNHSIMVDNGLITSCHNCRVIKRSSETPSSPCSDCNGTRKIQLFTSTVKCGCTTKKGWGSQ